MLPIPANNPTRSGGAFLMKNSKASLRRGFSMPVHKQEWCSPDVLREETWSMRRRNNRLRRGRSVTDDDLEELRACLDLGFTFDSPELDPKLSSTFPALELYHRVNQNYEKTLARSSSAISSDSETASCSGGSPTPIVNPDDDPATIKTKLRQWAQVVACSVRKSSSNL